MKINGFALRNKRKITRAFNDHSYWREILSTSKGKRRYYHIKGKGEFVWTY